MGGFISRLVERLRGLREVRLLMLGLDNAGKTTILYKLKFNQTVTTIPTAGFNVECLIHKNVKFHVWDVGGQDKIRPLWRHYHTGTKALIFVIDSQDRDRIHEARVELHRILAARELTDAILLIFANKQDLAHSMSTEEVRERLQLDKFPNRIWTVRASCATSGDGLIDGLNWLAENIRNPKRLPAATSSDNNRIGSPVAPPSPLSSSPMGLASAGSPVFSAASAGYSGNDAAADSGNFSPPPVATADGDDE